jgi:hypothetical protein
MRQKLCRRIKDLERIHSAAVARRVDSSGDYERKMATIMSEVDAWHANPVNQQWLAEQPPDYLRIQMQSLERELEEIASGRRRGIAA